MKNKLGDFFCSRTGQWLALLVFCSIIYLVNLGCEGLYSAQEARAGVVARHILESGNWLTMDLKGAPTTEKPMFCYWIYAVCGMIFGINEFSVRLPSVLSAIATIVMTVWLAGRIYGPKTGFVAGYLLATMATFLNLGRTARIDIILTAFYMLAMVFLYKAYFEKMTKSRLWLYLFYLALGVSILVKGPVGVAMAAVMLTVYMVVFRRWRMISEFEPWTGLLIMAAIAVPWYWYASLSTHGAFFKDFIIEHNLKRFFGGSDFKEGEFMPLYWYLPKFFAGALPWTLFLPFAVWQFRKRFFSLRQETVFLALWFVTGFIFFTCSAVKRGDYILPLYPAAAILLGRYVVMLDDIKPKLSGKWIYFWGGVTVLLAAFLATVKFGWLAQFGTRVAENNFPHLSSQDGEFFVLAATVINDRFLMFVLAAAACLGFLYLVCRVLAKGEVIRAIAWFLPGLTIGLIGYFTVFTNAINPYKTVKYFCRDCAAIVPADQKVTYIWNLNTEVLYFLRNDYDFTNEDKDADAMLRDAKYLIIEKKAYRRWFLQRSERDQFRLAAQTIPNHHYGNVLLVRIKPVEAPVKK